jgi:hypothetical protein
VEVSNAQLAELPILVTPEQLTTELTIDKMEEVAWLESLESIFQYGNVIYIFPLTGSTFFVVIDTVRTALS